MNKDMFRILTEDLGMCEHDAKKHIRQGVYTFDFNSYLEMIESTLDDDEVEKFLNAFEKTNKSSSCFYHDDDLVVIDGEKIIIQYVL